MAEVSFSTYSNLPFELTSFIGRERELAEIKSLLATTRLVTLTGTGGCGKTRLALQMAYSVGNLFGHGVWLVDLVPLREPALVPQHVAHTLGLHPGSNQPLKELLLELLRDKQMLLLLDNCEHLIAACAELIKQLLTEADSLQILATSRQPLALPGEITYQVQGLTLPLHNKATARDSQDWMQYDAVRLFVERARAISPHFTINQENALAIIDICQRLDGIPLALELASARVNVLTPHQIAARLDHRFALLTSGERTTLLTHHQTLRAAFDWSYDLLSGEEQTLLRRLAVFEAGFSLETAEGVCAGDGLSEEHFIDLLSLLINKSLAVAETVGRAEARYRLLETIREYALQKLDESGELTGLRNRHLDLFVARAEEIAPKLEDSPYQSLWRNWLEGEFDNLRGALNWALQSAQVREGLRLAVALWVFWMSRGSLSEGRSWLERLLAQADDRVPFLLRVRATINAGMMAGFMGDAPGAKAHERTAVALCEGAGEEGLRLLSLVQAPLALAAIVDGDFAKAYEILEQIVQRLRQVGDDIELIMALGTQSLAALGMGKLQLARALIQEALSIAHEVGDPYRTAIITFGLGQLEHCEQNYGRAQDYFQQALLGLRRLGKMREEPFTVFRLALARLHQGDFNQAHTLLCESLTLYKSQGNAKGMAEPLVGFGAMASERGMQAEAVRLLAAAAALGGTVNMSVLRAKGMEYERYMQAARVQLTEEELERAQEEGRAQTLEQAIEHALSLPLVPAMTVVKPKDEFKILTAREHQIAALIGQGMTNGEIAGRLVLSRRTVEKHVTNILSKLELNRRAELVRWVIEHGLIAASE